MADSVREKLYTTSNKFVDVKEDRWSNEYISTMANGKYVNGYNDGTFKPAAAITRAEFVELLFRMSGEKNGETKNFQDVKAVDWYSNAVYWAVERGITSGTFENHFSPNDNITREMAVVFISRYLECKGIELQKTEGAEFSDNEEISELL